MKNLLKAFFLFLFPIFKQAVIQTAADGLTKMAYPDTRRRSTQIRLGPDDRSRVHMGPAKSMSGQVKKNVFADPTPFHDVLMVAFDIFGPNQALAEEFIANYLPEPGVQTFKGQRINLDSFWFANDVRGDGSDTDSAVFVTKGKQAEARALLREHGLVG